MLLFSKSNIYSINIVKILAINMEISKFNKTQSQCPLNDDLYKIIIIRVFYPRAGLSIQAQAPRLEFCSKAGLPPQTQEPGFTRDKLLFINIIINNNIIIVVILVNNIVTLSSHYYYYYYYYYYYLKYFRNPPVFLSPLFVSG